MANKLRGVAPDGTDRRPDETNRDDYSDDETEFLKAVRDHQKATGKRFLAHTDYLKVARSLGYRRIGGDGA